MGAAGIELATDRLWDLFQAGYEQMRSMGNESGLLP
jgi:hypothetical protein